LQSELSSEPVIISYTATECVVFHSVRKILNERPVNYLRREDLANKRKMGTKVPAVRLQRREHEQNRRQLMIHSNLRKLGLPSAIERRLIEAGCLTCEHVREAIQTSGGVETLFKVPDIGPWTYRQIALNLGEPLHPKYLELYRKACQTTRDTRVADCR
jgi:hypothetical protein